MLPKGRVTSVWSPSLKLTTLPNQVTIDIVVVDMFLAVEQHDSTCFFLNPPLLLISKAQVGSELRPLRSQIAMGFQ